MRINDAIVPQSVFFVEGHTQNEQAEKYKTFYTIFGQTFEVEATYHVINIDKKGCFPLPKKLSPLFSQGNLIGNTTSNQNDDLKFCMSAGKVHASYISVHQLNQGAILIAQYTSQFNNATAVMDRAFDLKSVYPVSTVVTNLESFSAEFTGACVESTKRELSKKRKELTSHKRNLLKPKETISSITFPQTQREEERKTKIAEAPHENKVSLFSNNYATTPKVSTDSRKVSKGAPANASKEGGLFVSILTSIVNLCTRTGSKSTPKIAPVTSAMITENRLQIAREKIEKYEGLLKKIREFITANPRLQQLCKEYMLIDGNIVIPNDVKEHFNPNDEIEVMTQAALKGNKLEFVFNEWMEFLQRNQVVANAFKSHIERDPNLNRAFQEFMKEASVQGTNPLPF
jgi:hypothetical protein